jgi:short-subunit dehydrogenase involved in D-alanine esterification of teichoic acids
MLAALLNKKPLVKILIDEAGIIDNLDFQAIDYTSDKEIIEMLTRRGEAIFEEDN